MERLAVGRTAEVFRLDAGFVLKLFYPGTPLVAIEREAAVSRAVRDSGVSAPAVFEIIQHDGRTGIVYERVGGPTLLEVLLADFCVAGEKAREMAEWHTAIHSRRAVNLPNLKRRLAQRIEAAEGLPDSYRKWALQRLDNLPNGEGLCHGDFHPGNIVLTTDGAVPIDWNDAALGDPAADVARSLFLLADGAPQEELPPALAAGRQAFADAYLSRYSQLRAEDVRRVELWLPVIIAARFAENIPEERSGLLALLDMYYP
jgi:uncharacterized protein (TIGR02172 family)